MRTPIAGGHTADLDSDGVADTSTPDRETDIDRDVDTESDRERESDADAELDRKKDRVVDGVTDLEIEREPETDNVADTVDDLVLLIVRDVDTDHELVLDKVPTVRAGDDRDVVDDAVWVVDPVADGVGSCTATPRGELSTSAPLGTAQQRGCEKTYGTKKNHHSSVCFERQMRHTRELTLLDDSHAAGTMHDLPLVHTDTNPHCSHAGTHRSLCHEGRGCRQPAPFPKSMHLLCTVGRQAVSRRRPGHCNA